MSEKPIRPGRRPRTQDDWEMRADVYMDYLEHSISHPTPPTTTREVLSYFFRKDGSIGFTATDVSTNASRNNFLELRLYRDAEDDAKRICALWNNNPTPPVVTAREQRL